MITIVVVMLVQYLIPMIVFENHSDYVIRGYDYYYDHAVPTGAVSDPNDRVDGTQQLRHPITTVT